MLRLQSPVRIQAAAGEGKSRRVTINAYTGVAASGFWFRPFVIELAGLRIAATTPLLVNHENKLSSLVGSGRGTIEKGVVIIRGEVTAPNEMAKQVNDHIDAGTPLQASVGIELLEPAKTFRKGETFQANGRTFTAGEAGLDLCAKSFLREVSFCALGADPNTVVIRAGYPAGASSMTFEAWLASIGLDASTIWGGEQRANLMAAHARLYPPPDQAATAAELQAVLANGASPLMARAMSEGWTLARAKTEGLAFVRASRPSPAIVTGRPDNGGGIGANHLAAALLVRAGRSAIAETAFGADVMEQSRRLHQASFVDLCMASLQSEGREVPHNRNQMIQASLSGGSMPTALGSSADKILEAVWREAKPTWRSWCAVRGASNFKEQTGLRPTFGGDLKEVPEGGGFDHGTLGESTFPWKVATFGKTYKISRQAIVNDDLGAFSELIPGLAKAALRTTSDLVYRTLLGNAGNFFHASNGNLSTGGASALSVTSLAAAVKALRLQQDPDGNTLDLAPAVLGVPPELEVTARGLLQSAELARATDLDDMTGGMPTGNTMKNLATLEIESRLSSGVPATNHMEAVVGSATAWYLFASASDMPMVVGFLDGRESPTVEMFGFNSDPEVLAMTFRVYLDVGAALADHRAAQKANGG
jgi:hypothetical protein